MLTKAQKKAALEVAESWRTFIEGYQELDIDQIHFLLDEENKRPYPRRSILLRLHQRFSSLRTSMERKEILK